MIHNYAVDLKATNPGSNVIVEFERQHYNELPIFQRMYICLASIREGFLGGHRRITGLDGCLLKGLLKRQLLVVVGRDRNNQMFPIAWVVVQKETSKTWTWFIDLLKSDLGIVDGFGWASVSDMQKV